MDIQNELQNKLFEKISNDNFAKFMGIKLESLKPGYARLSMTFTKEMLNFHGIIHGGAIFALADAAFAASSNSHGITSIALNMNINFLSAVQPGQKLIAEGSEEKAARKIGVYRITVKNVEGELIAVAEGVVYRKESMPFEDNRLSSGSYPQGG
jgi:acyl-CoA thioesterase